ncbi:MAG: hypothetical protein JO171_03220 [Paludibacterium sp.]|nr:hypothetical protein [Paludibacterium sp.]MBV8046135.1 hypothetical protein [Paludibacterium sp.]MBV8648799.1 hypothetical protein [Paludibacterium sp.]
MKTRLIVAILALFAAGMPVVAAAYDKDHPAMNHCTQNQDGSQTCSTH